MKNKAPIVGTVSKAGSGSLALSRTEQIRETVVDPYSNHLDSTKTSSFLRVLIVEGDEGDFNLIRDLINDIQDQAFEIEWCSNYDEGYTAILGGNHDIYFIDYFLGTRTGMDLLRQAISRQCASPIVLLTGEVHQKIDLEAIRAGAADHLIKSEITRDKLDRCIRYSLERAATLKTSLANERKFRTIFEHSKDVIFLSTDELIFREVNAAAIQLFGYTSDELLKFSIYDLMIHPEEVAYLKKRMNSNHEIIDLPIRLRTRDDKTKSCMLSSTFEVDSFGNHYIQGIIQDISVLKKVEEIRIQSEKLETKAVVIRTLSHEIRNPLHNITLALGYLKIEVSKENLEFLNVIERNSKRINDLINQLMDSNQYHKMNLDVIPLQLVINDTLKKAEDQITLRNIKLKLNLPKKDANALVDRERLEIAFLNVIVNAIDAMAPDKGELSISITSDNDFHKVTINDNGCGMSEDSTLKVFEPYFTTKPKGLGLGLATTYAIVQSHKAEIDVSSVVNEGTTFTFKFPSI